MKPFESDGEAWAWLTAHAFTHVCVSIKINPDEWCEKAAETFREACTALRARLEGEKT